MGNTPTSLMPTEHSPQYASEVPYVSYAGDGEPPTWPIEEDWLSFDELFSANKPIIRQSCTQFSAANPSIEEMDVLQNAIEVVARQSDVDQRFVFAIVMQESNGCVRAPTTFNGVRNPGLMQDHNGNASCNDQGIIQTPCPADVVLQMISNGVKGTETGLGLKQCIQDAGTVGASKYYRAARLYNSGAVVDTDLSIGDGTACFASDVANRLMGWTFAPHVCLLDKTLTFTSSATAYQTITITRTWMSKGSLSY